MIKIFSWQIFRNSSIAMYKNLVRYFFLNGVSLFSGSHCMSFLYFQICKILQDRIKDEYRVLSNQDNNSLKDKNSSNWSINQSNFKQISNYIFSAPPWLRGEVRFRHALRVNKDNNSSPPTFNSNICRASIRICQPLKGVFAKNERGYRLNVIKKRFWSLLILLLSVASIKRNLLKTSHTE